MIKSLKYGYQILTTAINTIPITVWYDMNSCLKPTTDSKTMGYKGQQNTYGLLPGPHCSCPHATTAKGGCWYAEEGNKNRTCYVDSLANFRPAVRNLLTENFILMKQGDTYQVSEALNSEFDRFEKAEDRRKAKGLKTFMNYRLHWSGDFFNHEYTLTVAKAIDSHPRINFWGYTRNFDVLDAFSTCTNLVMYLSIDEVNVQQGLLAYEEHNGPMRNNLRLAYMGKDPSIDAAKAAVLRDLEERNRIRVKDGKPSRNTDWLTSLRLSPCPVDNGGLKYELGCATCGRCFRSKKENVFFKT